MNLNIHHIIKNPIVLVSAVGSAIGWLMAFIGTCILGGRAGGFWWTLIYELLLLSSIMLAIYKQCFQHHQLMFLTFLGVSIAMLTLHVDGFMAYSDGGSQVAGAGAVIMIVMQFFWVILFGSTEESILFQYIYASVTVPVNRHLSPKESKVALSAPEAYSPTIPPSISKIYVNALHPYQANPEDPNELSFNKDEQLEILNKSGNWWQAKKSDGSIGIVPSNYFSS